MRSFATGLILGLLVLCVLPYYVFASGPLFTAREVNLFDESIKQFIKADFDNDGKPELAVNVTDRVIYFVDYINSGHLTNISELSAADRTSLICSGDYDNDGRQDLAIIGYYSDSIYIYLNNSNFDFEQCLSFYAAPAGHITDIKSVDITGDQYSDIIILKDSIGICENIHGCMFTSPAYIHAARQPNSFFLADLDNDQDIDIGCVYNSAKKIKYFLNTGQGDFIPGDSIIINRSLVEAMVGDFNDDGLMDILIRSSSRYLTVILKTPSGFGNPIDIACSQVPNSICIGDFDSDDDSDFACVDYVDDKLYIFLNDDNGNFVNDTSVYFGEWPCLLNTDDFDGDDYLDFVVSNTSAATLSVLYGIGNGRVYNSQYYLADNEPRSITASDFNNDAFPDLAVANYSSHTVITYLNNGLGYFQPDTSINISGGPRTVYTADFDNDNDNDLAVTDYDSGLVKVFNNDGNGYFTATGQYSAGNNPIIITGAEFNGLNGIDFAVSSYSSGAIYFLYNDGSGSFSNGGFISCICTPSPLWVCDLDLDNDTDIIYGCPQVTGSVIADSNMGQPNQFRSFTVLSSGYIVSLCAFDYDNDHFPDIAALDSYEPTSWLYICRNNRDFRFPQIRRISIASGASSIRAADFNDDGFQDLAITISFANCVGILLGDGTGNFSDFQFYGTGIAPTSMAVGDFNNDGFPDLAVSNKESDNITVLLNRTQVNKIPDNSPFPKSYHLTAYPNPFNSNAVISFNQPTPGHVALTIYDILGRKVDSVYDGYLPAGNRDFTWQAGKYPSGIYFALTRSSDIAESVKLTLIK